MTRNRYFIPNCNDYFWWCTDRGTKDPYAPNRVLINRWPEIGILYRIVPTIFDDVRTGIQKTPNRVLINWWPEIGILYRIVITIFDDVRTGVQKTPNGGVYFYCVQQPPPLFEYNIQILDPAPVLGSRFIMAVSYSDWHHLGHCLHSALAMILNINI